ncbi:MAG: cytochrome bc1 complex diheme cytochrome c subunit [Streptosporangiaceae bacterium]
MSPISLRRRRPVAGYALIGSALLLIGLIYALITTGQTAAASSPSPSQQAQISQGRAIFVEECASCHGLFAQGIPRVGPSLIGVGSAAVNFQVSSGRMPAKEPVAEMPQKPVALNPEQIKALGTYIQSLGGGPVTPSAAMVSQTGANPGIGQQLFVADCAQCHNFVGAGGALTYGKYAPPLTNATPTQIYEAMLTGPEAMPVFNNTTITPQQKRDIIAYVVQTRSEPNPGGFSLGRIGPVTEGLVAFLGLLLFMVFAALWITAKHGKSHE